MDTKQTITDLEIQNLYKEIEQFLQIANIVLQEPVRAIDNRKIINDCEKHINNIENIIQFSTNYKRGLKFLQKNLMNIIVKFNNKINCIYDNTNCPIHINENKKISGPFEKKDKKKRGRYLDTLSDEDYYNKLHGKERKRRNKNSGKKRY